MVGISVVKNMKCIHMDILKALTILLRCEGSVAPVQKW